MSALEVLATTANYQTPQDEFQSIPKPRFLQEALAAGQRADDDKKRRAAARAKQRLADQAKAKLQ